MKGYTSCWSRFRATERLEENTFAWNLNCVHQKNWACRVLECTTCAGSAWWHAVVASQQFLAVCTWTVLKTPIGWWLYGIIRGIPINQPAEWNDKKILNTAHFKFSFAFWGFCVPWSLAFGFQGSIWTLQLTRSRLRCKRHPWPFGLDLTWFAW